MAKFNYTYKSDGITYTGVTSLNTKAYKMYFNGNDGTSYYLTRRSFSENLNDAKNTSFDVIKIFVIIMFLLLMSNFFSSINTQPVFGELRAPTDLTIDTLITTLTDVTDFEFTNPLEKAFKAIERVNNFQSLNDPVDNSFLSSIQNVLNSIFTGIRTLVNGIVFLINLVINLIEMVYGLFKVLILFFT